MFPHSRHAVARSGTRTWSHVLKGIPPSRGDPEGSEISKIVSFLGPAAKDIHHVAHKRSCVAFPRRRDVPNAFKLRPRVRVRRIGPNVVEPMHAVRAAKEIEFISPSDHSMVGSRGRNLTMGWATINGVLDEDLPFVCRLL